MKRIVFIILIAILSVSVSSMDVPELKGHINDYAGVISGGRERELESYLRQVEEQTSSQIVLLTINSLEDEYLEGYSMKVAEEWKIGQQDYDNGVLILLTMAEKKVRIEVGYGLEDIITDAVSSYVIRNYMIPSFRQGDFYTGLKNGVVAVGGLITKDFQITPEELARFRKKQEEAGKGSIPIGFIVFVIIMILSMFKRRTRRRGLLGSSIFYLGGGFGGSSGGGGSFGGFSGGGGSFGGGGASGGW